jgi:hypothetical protein
MPESRLLFRYRDLVAATIEEHQRIISERGWCWWGWWKRPSEDSRSDIWDDLARQTETDDAVEVGLFDSGSGAIRRALVTSIIRPAGIRGAENTIKVPPQEADHVRHIIEKTPSAVLGLRSPRLIPNQSIFLATTRLLKRQN